MVPSPLALGRRAVTPARPIYLLAGHHYGLRILRCSIWSCPIYHPCCLLRHRNSRALLLGVEAKWGGHSPNENDFGCPSMDIAYSYSYEIGSNFSLPDWVLNEFAMMISSDDNRHCHIISLVAYQSIPSLLLRNDYYPSSTSALFRARLLRQSNAVQNPI